MALGKNMNMGTIVICKSENTDEFGQHAYAYSGHSFNARHCGRIG